MGFKQRFYQLVGGSFVALTIVTSSALAEELDNWSFDATTNELTFSLSDTVLPEFFLLAEPPRLVLDIPDTQIGAVEPEQFYSGAVQNIRVAQHAPDQVRVVIELAPDTVLSPDQADIQFDDNNGQRHWRFRPLLADSPVIADAPTPVQPPISAEADVSLSAANLELSKPSAEAVLPIDPYASASSEQQVSVPPLEDIPASADVATANSVTEPAAGLDLPPMTVPDLEVTEVDGAAADETADLTAAQESVLPDLAARETGVKPTVEAALSEVPQEVLPAAAEVEPAQAVADSVDTVTTAVAAVPDEVVAVPDEAVAEETTPAWQTIQQPAADRTIMQTDAPAPLTFGQPLPSQSR
ncbi:AMIN domain-containing protein [Leptolyngbya cf. ectocarpi LEGE 11479]|uniref:AMIN domain-containing protein n=1 Tax=Leptolyngbya cf. ectocarpi LEGE 11479 TaxID=1828722 RepID=A0A928ZZJ3_LEPEC|nr:AMIN domain-containing protein [Leptolyngbya ectocarpi]MBE9070315.1 AMIN domain-containing protein [Leptolyngbya cf. ectocarpi LEGE 11479]